MSSLKSLAKGSLILLVSNIVLKAINFLLLPLYTSYLTPSDYGIVDLAITACSLFISIFSLCLDTGFFTFFYDEGSEKHKKEIFNSTFFTTILVAIIPIIGIIFSKPIARILFKSDQSTVVILMLVTISFTIIGLIPIAQIKINNQMYIFGGINVIIGLTSIILNVVMVVILKVGYISLIITNMLVAIIQLLCYIFLVRKNISIKHFNLTKIKGVLQYTLPLIPATISTWILDLSDRYFINSYYSSFEVGLYGVANKIVIILIVLLGAFQTAYPSFVFSNANNEEEDSREKFRVVLNTFMCIFLTLGVSISIFSKEIITIMTNSDYLEAYKMVPFLIYSQIIYGVAFVVGAGMSIAKKSKISMKISWLAASINIGLNILFIPTVGAKAAAITTMVSFFVVAILNYIYSQKCYRINYDFKKAISVFIVTFTLAIISINFNFGTKIIMLVISYILICIVYKKVVLSGYYFVKEKIKEIL